MRVARVSIVLSYGAVEEESIENRCHLRQQVNASCTKICNRAGSYARTLRDQFENLSSLPKFYLPGGASSALNVLISYGNVDYEPSNHFEMEMGEIDTPSSIYPCPQVLFYLEGHISEGRK